MRAAFIETLAEMAAEDEKIFLVSGDSGFRMFEGFIEHFPDRFLNSGVAEQNAIGVSAGMAMSGKTVFVFNIIPFALFRCFEQLRNDICYQNLNVKIVGIGAGLAYAQLGPTHHSIEDLAVARSLPNLKVIAPADPVETRFMVREAAKISGPVYLRLGRGKEDAVYADSQEFAVGKGIVLKEGVSLVVIITTGTILKNVLEAASILEGQGLSATVIAMSTVKPLDKDIIADLIYGSMAVFVVEEHSVEGGLGDAVASAILESGCDDFIFRKIGIADRFVSTVGNHDYLRAVAGLSPEAISQQILKEVYG